MAVLVDANTDEVTRSANLPGAIFTIAGWARIVSDIGATTDQPIAFALDGAATDGWALYWQTAAGNGMEIISFDGGAISARTQLASRPAVGGDFFWYVRCNGDGTDTMEAGWLAPGATTYVTATLSFAATIALHTTLYLGGVLSTYYSNHAVWGVKCWNRFLTPEELLVEARYRRVKYPSSLQWHWPIETASDTRDLSGNGYAPTLTSVATTTGGRIWTPRRRIILPAAAGGATANPTGVAGTGAVGTIAATGAASVALTGVSATGAVGTLTAQADGSTVLLQGIAGAGQVGSLAVDLQQALTGVAGTGAAGTLSATGEASATLTGVSAAGSAGVVAPPVYATIIPVGVEATGEIGTIARVLRKALTGVAATGQVGTLSATAASTSVSLNGVAATSTVGTLSALGSALSTLTGVAGVTAVGSLTEAHGSTIALTGLSATGLVGSVSVSASGNSNVTLTGVQAMGTVGTLDIFGDASVALTGVGATGSVGTVSVGAGSRISLAGVSAVGSAGVLSLGTILVPASRTVRLSYRSRTIRV